MQKWEYKTVDVYISNPDGMLELNEWYEDGWEYVDSCCNKKYLFVTIKRLKP